MPEAFSSVADMRVVIDSSTEKLEAGLTAAKNLVARFAADGGQDLSLFDRAMGRGASGVEAMAGKLGGIITRLNKYKAALDLVAEGVSYVGDQIASQTGTEDEWGNVKKSADDLQQSLVNGLGVAFDNVKDSALATAASIAGFDANAVQAESTARGVASGGFGILKTAIDNVKYAYETTFLSDAHQSNDVLERRIGQYTEIVGKLESQLQSLSLINILDNGADQKEVDLMKERIEGFKTQIFLLNQMVGAQTILDNAKADAAVEQSKGIEGLRAETEAMELNVETMRMSTAERQIFLALRKAEHALDDEESLDDDAKQRVLDKYQDRMQDAAAAVENYNNAKKHDEDAQQFLDRMIQETDNLRDRVDVLGMATVAAEAYTAAARNARATDKLGFLDADQQATVETQMSIQMQLRLQLMAAADERQREEAAKRDNAAVDQSIAGMARQTAQIRARTAAMIDGSEAGRVQAIVDQQLATLEARHIDLKPQRIAAIRAEAEAQVAASMEMEEVQRRVRLIGEIGNAVTSNLDSAFRRWASGSKVSVKEMAASILADLAEIQFKAAVLNPLANFLSGSQSGGGGILGSLFGLGGGSSSSSSWITSVIPAFADGGDFPGGPMIVGEEGPELIWPKFPGRVIPNNALPAAAAASGPSVINMSVAINAQGAYPESIADIKAALAETQASIPQTAVAAWQEAKDRGVV